MLKESFFKRELMKRKVLSTVLLLSVIVNVFAITALYRINADNVTGVKSQGYIENSKLASERDNSDIGKVDSSKEKIAESTESQMATQTNNGIDTVIDSEEEISLLEKVVYAEAAGEGFDGKLAVANVILNRLGAEGWPKTLKDVIFQKSQFTPAMTGKIYRVTPDEETKNAVRDALAGTRIIDSDVFYFVNLDIATDHVVPDNKTFVVRIGAHSFFKD